MENIILSAAWQITGVILFLSMCVCIGLSMYEVVPVEEDEQTPQTQHNSTVCWITEKAS